MKTIDLFSGCGGLSLGFQNAGIEVVASYDNWEPAVKVYKENFNHPIYSLDIGGLEDYSIFKKHSFDMVIGGPPCQDFSSAGKRDETLGRADLTKKFAEIVCYLKPQRFVMENVERIKKSNILKETLDIFSKAGYGLTSTVLDASLCGVPQKRKRYFLIGELNGIDGHLEYYLTKEMSNKPMTIHDYLGDSLGGEFYYRHPRSYQRRGIFSIYEPSPTIRGVNRPLPKTYKKHPGDKCEPSNNVRALTTIERSYIQTFPKDFKWLGNKSNLEQMIGNAVPVNLGTYVAKAVTEYVRDKEKGSQKLASKEGQTKLALTS